VKRVEAARARGASVRRRKARRDQARVRKQRLSRRLPSYRQAASIRLEREHRGDDKLEIVLIGSDSIETVRRTHSNYFGNGTGVPFRKLVS
jgi:hypothetical protein